MLPQGLQLYQYIGKKIFIPGICCIELILGNLCKAVIFLLLNFFNVAIFTYKRSM